MNGNKNYQGLQIITNNNNKIRVNGMKILKVNNIHTLWLWSQDKIQIHEFTSWSTGQETSNSNSPRSVKTEFAVKAKVIQVFYWVGEVAYAVDESGTVHSFQSSIHSSKSPLLLMDVDDIFCSPQYMVPSLTWVQNSEPVMKVDDSCDKVISACQLTAGFAVTSMKDEHLVVFVYAYPDFNLQLFMDAENYTPYTAPNNLKGDIVSSCSMDLMTLPLKQLFQENSQEFDSEIIIIGLKSGLVVWFFVRSPPNGPFVLCYVHQQVQEIHWIKDEASGLFCYLIIVLSSGRVVIFGEKENVTLCLPEPVISSCIFKNFLVTSNLSNCHSSILHLKKEISLSSFLLAVKGACAIAVSPDLNTLVVATIHGTLYSLDPTVTSADTSSHFVIPDQSLLDSMFVQTQTLEKIYLELNKEDGIMTALSTAAAMNSIQNSFEVNIQVISGAEFVISAKLLKTNMVFTRNMWLACVEVNNDKGERETLLCSLKEDFHRSADLSLNVTLSLSIGDVVSLQLVLFLEKQLPLISVLLNKVEIDACHMMSSTVISPNMTCFQTTSLNSFLYSHKDLPKKPLKEFECAMKIPHNFNVDSILIVILKDSRHRILCDWSNTSGGTKRSIQVCVMTTPVQLNLNIDSKELTITCCNIHLCHNIKESIQKRLNSSEKKYITENIIMDMQALYQTYEIEKLKENPNSSTMDMLWKRLRSTVSFQLSI